jgi:hypothetical protein
MTNLLAGGNASTQYRRPWVCSDEPLERFLANSRAEANFSVQVFRGDAGQQ